MENHTFLGDGKHRIAFLGDSGVGKSSLVDLLKGGEFNMLFKPTVGTEITDIGNVRIFDFSGREKYDIPLSLDLNLNHVLIFYESCSKSSYTNQLFWKSLVNSENFRRTFAGERELGVTFVRTKSDLINKNQGKSGIPICVKDNKVPQELRDILMIYDNTEALCTRSPLF